MSFLHSKPILILNVLIISLLLGTGCKDDDSPSQPGGTNLPTIISFSANPSIIQAIGDTVVLSWKVSGATSLSILGGVGSVTPVDSGSKSVFVAAATTFTLTATNSAGSVNANTVISAAQTISVNGFVKDYDGEPIFGATVMIKGKTPTSTSAAGTFSFSNVNSPYEITLIYPGQIAIVYEGLTRQDPTLLYLGSTTPTKSATIRGSVPPAPGKETRVIFVSGTKAWFTTANPGTGIFSFNAVWHGSTVSYSGKLHVLRWTPNVTGFPDTYDAYGGENLTISDGGLFDNNDFTPGDLTDPAEQNIAGSIIRPTSSYNVNAKSLSLNFGAASVQLAGEMGASLTDEFSYTVPNISGVTFEVSAQAKINAIPTDRTSMYRKKGIAGGTSGITLTLADAPQLNLPAHNGTNVDTTTQFLWTQGSGAGINLVLIAPDPGPGPIFYIFCAGNNCYIPNLLPQGMGCPANKDYAWIVNQYFPISSINDAASDAFIPLIMNTGGDFGNAASQTFKFKTPPL